MDSHFFAKLLLNLMDGSFVKICGSGDIWSNPNRPNQICGVLWRSHLPLTKQGLPIVKGPISSFMLHVQWKIHLQSDVSLIDYLYVYQSVPLIILNSYFFRLPQNCQEVGDRHSFHRQNSPSRLAIPSTINVQDTSRVPPTGVRPRKTSLNGTQTQWITGVKNSPL